MQKAFVSVIGFIILILIFTSAACAPQTHPSRAKIVTQKTEQKTKPQPALPAATQDPGSNNDKPNVEAEVPIEKVKFTDIQMMTDPQDNFTELPEGWALGESISTTDYQVSYHVYHTTDFAKTFMDVTAYELLTTKYSGSYLFKGAFIDKNTTRIANCNLNNGNYETQIYGTDDTGRSWFGPVTLPEIESGKGQMPINITFLNAKEGWVLTQIASSKGELEARGGLYHTNDGGKTWTLLSDTVKHHTLPDLHPYPIWNNWIAFKDSKIGFTPGKMNSNDRNMILYETTDGGKRWKQTNMALPVPGKGENRIILKPTFMADHIELPVVITDGNKVELTIYESKNSGKTWSKTGGLITEEGLANALNAHIIKPNQYWFFTGNILYINDGGHMMQFDVISNLPGALEKLHQVGNQFWLVTSSGEILVSDNNGKSWHKP